MIDFEKDNTTTSEVFDKRGKKPGLFSGLFKKKEYDEGYDEEEELIQPISPAPGKRSARMLLDDDDDISVEETFTPPPPPPPPAGARKLLDLLDDDDDDTHYVHVEEELQEDDYPVSSDDDKEEDIPEPEPEPEPEPVPEPEPEPEPEPVETVASYQDTVESVVKKEADLLEIRADILANAGYNEIIEALSTKVMLYHEVPNISLESFGAVASTYEPCTLEITTFGKHRFAGNPLTDKQRIILFLQIEELVEKARKENSSRIHLKATQQVQHEGIIYRTLLLSDELLEDYMNAYNRTIMTNGDVAPLHELAVIINL